MDGVGNSSDCLRCREPYYSPRSTLVRFDPSVGPGRFQAGGYRNKYQEGYDSRNR